MTHKDISLSPNKLVRYLQKPADEFTQQDIIRYIEDNGIEMLNFRYVAGDGKLKTLNFIISSREHLENILAGGERVDGSSLFSFIEAGSSDLYILPRFRTAFLNPFTDIPTLEILCSFFTSEGKPLESAPDYILQKATNLFQEQTGAQFKSLGELEYYVIGDKTDLYPGFDQKGYHESQPFTNYESLRIEALQLIAQAGGRIKYGHSEVGNFCDEQYCYEQHEIEFLPTSAEHAADTMVIAKWILRMLGEKYGVNISFAPKITVGKAGSGMHFHMLAEKNGRNLLVENEALSPMAKKMIAGILDIAPALTAFGNTVPTSYLRLVPNQEAPTYVCWGDRNRSVLVRVPLGWLNTGNEMLQMANPSEKGTQVTLPNRQTFEFRVPDGSADIHYLLAGLIIGSLHGLNMPDALEKAEQLYAPVDIFQANFKERLNELVQLPDSCFTSAEELNKQRAVFEANDIFPAGTLNQIIESLKAYEDKQLSEKLYGKHDEIKKLVNRYLHAR